MLIAAPLTGARAVLAGLPILTAQNMAKPHRGRSYPAGRRSDKFLMLLTIVLTVVADLTIAIGTGVAIGLALRLQRRKMPPADWTPPER